MPHVINCQQFLDRYSDYRDGQLHGLEQLLVESHLSTCPRCQEYDARVARGVIVLKNSGEIEPPRWLKQELHARIAASNRRDFPLFPSYVGVLATLTLIISVGVVLWDKREDPVPTIVMDSAPSLPPPILARPATLEDPGPSLAVPAFGADWRAPGPEDESYLVWSMQVR